MPADDLAVYLRAETKAAVNAMRRAQKQTDSLAGQLGAMAKSAVKSFGMYVAAGLTIGAVTRTIRESVQAYGEQVQAENKLAAAIRATGGDADELLPKYKDIASEIQKVTTVGDEATLALMQQATSLGIADDNMKEATEGAIGLSKALGIGTQQAIRGVANALNGEFTTLQRYMPELRTATTESEKMAIVQRAMADGFKVAKAEADNGYGALLQYKNAAGDLKEQLGQVVTEGAKPFVSALTELVVKYTENIKKTREFKQALEALEGGAQAIGDMGIDEITLAIAAAEDEMTRLDWTQEERVQTLRNYVAALKEERTAKAELAKWQGIEADELNRQQQAEKAAAEARATAAEEQRKDMDALTSAYAQTHAGQVAALESQIAYFETFKQGPMVVAVLGMLREKYAELTKTEEKLIDVSGMMEGVSRGVATAMEAEYARIQTVIDETNAKLDASKNSIQSHMQVAANSIMTFSEAMVDGSASWKDFGRIGTSVIASLLQALGQKYIVLAAENLAKFFAAPVWDPNKGSYLRASGKYAGASGLAFAAAGAVKSYATGGDFITSGPELIQVGDNASGRERVTVQPLGASGTGAGGVIINISGNTIAGPGGAEELAGYIVQAINRGQRSGRVEAFAS